MNGCGQHGGVKRHLVVRGVRAHGFGLMINKIVHDCSNAKQSPNYSINLETPSDTKQSSRT